MKKVVSLIITFMMVTALVSYGLMVDKVFANENNYYLHEKSNVDTINATTIGALPCIGEARVLVFYVDFLNGDKVSTKSAEELEDMFFSEQAKNDKSVAYIDGKDSVRSYYYRSSYGKVDITGDVFEYTTKYDTSHYSDTTIVADEVVDYYKDIIDWQNYDGNSDGCIDGIYIIANTSHSYGGVSNVASYSNQVSNMQIKGLCFLTGDDFETALHETCHMFGPPDMYEGVYVNPNGLYISCFMDSGWGDLPSPTKFVLGWLDDVKFIDSNNVGNYELRNYSDYGDSLIIYPNGDETNRNWFFVEYMVQDGQNPSTDGGIRVWRTQMNLDEFYNVNGAVDSTDGMIASPYEYLEVVHPDEIEDYCLQVGEKLSPYGYPSTAYSDTFVLEHTFGAKYLEELTFSGISIDFLNESDEIAKVNISIEDIPKDDVDVAIDFTINLPEESSEFLISNDKYNIVTLTSDVELKASGEAIFKKNESDKVIPLSYEMTENRKTINFYIDSSYLYMANQDIYYFIAPDIMTYYGNGLSYSAPEEPINLSQIPVPLKKGTETYDTNFNKTTLHKATSFYQEDGNVLNFLVNDEGKLLWNEFDCQNNTSENYELELPKNLGDINIYENLCCWTDQGVYYVYINDMICAYKDKKLINNKDISSLALKFCGDDHNSFFINWKKNEFYTMKNNDGNLILEKINIINEDDFTIINDLIDRMAYDSYKNLYYIGNDKYIACASAGYYFISPKGIEFYKNDCMQSGGHGYTSLACENDKIYMFLGGEDLVMRVYDYDFNLLKEKKLLNRISENTWGITSQSVELVDNMWVVSFETVFTKKNIGKENTVITSFDLKGNLINYYRTDYYGPHKLGVYSVIPLKNNLYLCVNDKIFSYINGEDNNCEHIWDNGEVFIEADHEVTGQRIYACENCEMTKMEIIPALGHSYGGWVIKKQATCTTSGMKCRECSCGKTISETIIPVAGHDWNSTYTIDKKATAIKNGSKSIHCSQCDATKSKTTIYYPKTVKLSTTSYTYNGKAKKPTVKVYNSKGKLIATSNYTVKYATGRKNVGKYKVTVTFKPTSKEYSGSKYTTFKINPKGTTFSTVTKGKKSFIAKWKKQPAKMSKTRITGYQIRYSTSSKMTNSKVKTVKGYGKTSLKVSKLKDNKKYYVQVRTYKTVNGSKYYSTWSKYKTVRTKT